MILPALTRRDASRMQHDARHRAFDPDLDPPDGFNPSAVDEFSQFQKRLIVNPFLAILSWILAGSILRLGLKARDLNLSAGAFLGILLSFLLVQFHCLDCGKTGWAFRVRRHRCFPDDAHGPIHEGRRSLIPTFAAQLKIWFVILFAAMCYYLLLEATATHR